MKAYTNDIEDITIQYTITYCNCKLTTLGGSTSMAELSVVCYSFTALFVSITSASTNLVWLESLTYGQSIAANDGKIVASPSHNMAFPFQIHAKA